jgi:hypothetical protein
LWDHIARGDGGFSVGAGFDDDRLFGIEDPRHLEGQQEEERSCCSAERSEPEAPEGGAAGHGLDLGFSGEFLDAALDRIRAGTGIVFLGDESVDPLKGLHHLPAGFTPFEMAVQRLRRLGFQDAGQTV